MSFPQPDAHSLRSAGSPAARGILGPLAGHHRPVVLRATVRWLVRLSTQVRFLTRAPGHHRSFWQPTRCVAWRFRRTLGQPSGIGSKRLRCASRGARSRPLTVLPFLLRREQAVRGSSEGGCAPDGDRCKPLRVGARSHAWWSRRAQAGWAAAWGRGIGRRGASRIGRLRGSGYG